MRLDTAGQGPPGKVDRAVGKAHRRCRARSLQHSSFAKRNPLVNGGKRRRQFLQLAIGLNETSMGGDFMPASHSSS